MRARPRAWPPAALLCVLLLGGGGLVCGLQQLFLGGCARRGGFAGGDGRETRASAWATRPGRPRRLADAGPHLRDARAISARASRAYQRADRLANGQNAEAIIGVAEALLAQDFEQIRSGAGHLFERALTLEPNNSKALLYSAFAAMSRGETASARERFQRMLTLNPPPEIRDIIEKQLLALDGGQAPQVAPPAQGAPRTGRQGREGGGACHARACAGQQGAGRGARCSSRRATRKRRARRSPSSGCPRHFRSTSSCQRPTPCSSRGASRRDRSSRSWRASPLGGTPTATSGDPFGQVSYHVGKDGKLNIVIDRLAP